MSLSTPELAHCVLRQDNRRRGDDDHRQSQPHFEEGNSDFSRVLLSVWTALEG